MTQSTVATAQEESVYRPVMARLLKVEPMTELEKLFTLELPGGRSLGNEPGQFVEISLFGIGEAPISISSSPSRSNGTFELCVRSVGDVTHTMHGMEPGALLGVRGPFGHGFPIEKMKGKDSLFAAGGLLVTAAILLSTRFARNQGTQLPDPWEPKPVKLPLALAIGFAQAFAIMPGISRSGSTIAMSLWLGLPRAEAARFSFLLSVPVIAGALLLEVLGGSAPPLTGSVPILGAAVVSFAVGLLAIRWTALAVVQSHFWKFSFYCVAVGIVSLVILS